jgi:RNA polymerase sigma factor (sigma-70 family)
MSEDDITNAYISMKSRLFMIVERIIKRHSEVEDVLQDAYIRTFLADKTQDIKSPEAFLTQTARNLALNQIKLSRVKYTSSIEDDANSTVSDINSDVNVEDTIHSQERFLKLCLAVKELPPQCRRVFILIKIYGFTYAEVKNKLKISEKTIEKHVAKGVKRCSEYLAATENVNTDLKNKGA